MVLVGDNRLPANVIRTEPMSFCTNADRVFASARAYTRKVARWVNVDSESGVTAIEYGLIAALVAVAIITAVTAVGTNLAGTFSYVAGNLPQGGS